ncbi:hypothetical protein SAMD00020551_1383 [Mesobacillus selenatarsenatis SF-1]|uniref:Uncharacterized protein n=1 Tax=Mesobacillus selenatarsenatis (strain DSM 18680 / JCM 14380 / FERM P-15431 / SF-1) TaxID=1321606 RepID=A0A0A8WZS9_MESS1|nr:hypothetical protein SAMD00020551_1383 [Mesobacillus selenatarsenatis SF-1]
MDDYISDGSALFTVAANIFTVEQLLSTVAAKIFTVGQLLFTVGVNIFTVLKNELYFYSFIVIVLASV